MNGAQTTFARTEIVNMLASSLGKELAEEVVETNLKKKGIYQTNLSKGEVLTLLEHLAQEPGLLGITARFAKARVLLNEMPQVALLQLGTVQDCRDLRP